METFSTRDVLDELLAQAHLPAAVSQTRQSGRGFDNEISTVALADGQRVLLRRFPKPRTSEGSRARFLAQHGLPVPALLASSAQGSLLEFIDGDLLGDLIESGRDTAGTWRLVGAAYSRVHAVGFPAGLAGEDFGPDQFVLAPVDPAEQLHRQIDDAQPGLERLLPDYLSYLPRLHEVVQMAAPMLRATPAAFGHGDINMWNILITPERAVLIDWDAPCVSDPALEIALLDKHASLFNNTGLPEAFFAGYGRPPVEPNTSLHRLVQTLAWAASSDWTAFETDQTLPIELAYRARGWLTVLTDYLRDLPTHLDRLHVLTGTRRSSHGSCAG